MCFGIFTSVSIGILAYSFATDDFTLEYVAAHSNSQLPTFFKVAATWGGHEGSKWIGVEQNENSKPRQIKPSKERV